MESEKNVENYLNNLDYFFSLMNSKGGSHNNNGGE
jgi:hypothetical protein